jgi:hypothetical protein
VTGRILEESSRHCPHKQTDTVALIYRIIDKPKKCFYNDMHNDKGLGISKTLFKNISKTQIFTHVTYVGAYNF